MISVTILGVVRTPSNSNPLYGYAYNTTYIVPNGDDSKLYGFYKNLSNTITTATNSKSEANSLSQVCNGVCGLPSSVSIVTVSMSSPAYIQTITPTSAPRWKPSTAPSTAPTAIPTAPSLTPSYMPTSPSLPPSKQPTNNPIVKPSKSPSPAPSTHSLAPSIQGQCFCNVKACITVLNVTQCYPGPNPSMID